mmetsp:Transcript_28729/g.83297  ORF Transcript_28729/g.83297 Transcript_28729/m.83297 type:complete len:221 (+) Transcript_28729:157-819(+)
MPEVTSTFHLPITRPPRTRTTRTRTTRTTTTAQKSRRKEQPLPLLLLLPMNHKPAWWKTMWERILLLLVLLLAMRTSTNLWIIRPTLIFPSSKTRRMAAEPTNGCCPSWPTRLLMPPYLWTNKRSIRLPKNWWRTSSSSILLCCIRIGPCKRRRRRGMMTPAPPTTPTVMRMGLPRLLVVRRLRRRWTRPSLPRMILRIRLFTLMTQMTTASTMKMMRPR